jgi:hypothetical protein
MTISTSASGRPPSSRSMAGRRDARNPASAGTRRAWAATSGLAPFGSIRKNRPPGASTRTASATTAAGSGTWCRTSRTSTVRTAPVAMGSSRRVTRDGCDARHVGGREAHLVDEAVDAHPEPAAAHVDEVGALAAADLQVGRQEGGGHGTEQLGLERREARTTHLPGEVRRIRGLPVRRLRGREARVARGCRAHRKA